MFLLLQKKPAQLSWIQTGAGGATPLSLGTCSFSESPYPHIFQGPYMVHQLFRGFHFKLANWKHQSQRHHQHSRYFLQVGTVFFGRCLSLVPGLYLFPALSFLSHFPQLQPLFSGTSCRPHFTYFLTQTWAFSGQWAWDGGADLSLVLLPCSIPVAPYSHH